MTAAVETPACATMRDLEEAYLENAARAGRTRQRDCRRCEGTGEWNHRSRTRSGICFACRGRGVCDLVDWAPAENDAATDYNRRISAALDAIRTHAHTITGRRNSDLQDNAQWGLRQLEAREPHRAMRALASLESGRLDDTLHALAAYYEDLAARGALALAD